MYVLVIEIRMLVEPRRQAERGPTALLVHQNLTAFKLWLGGPTQAAATPNRRCFFSLAVSIVRPENGSGGLEFWRVKKELRVDHRHVVGIQQEDFLEG